MANHGSHEVTRLLQAAGDGRREAADELMPLVYAELRKLARSRLAREGPGQSLQATALVHEAYVRLVGDPDYRWANRAHFFAAAAEAMRRVVIDRARARARIKHGGDLEQVELTEFIAVEAPAPEALIALNDVLTGLENQDRTMASVVKLRYFAGFTVPEVARALDLSPRSVNRLWTAGRAWLHERLTS